MVDHLQIEIKMMNNNSCEYAKQFVNIYYEKLDKSRSTFEKLYHDNANLVWNGNIMMNKDKIFELYKNLPISETILTTVDAHPVSYMENTENKKMLFITCVGTIKFSNQNPKTFSQNFVLVAETETENKNVWKIISDTFRFV